MLAIFEYTYSTDLGIIGLHSLITLLPLLKNDTVNVSTKLLLFPTPIMQFGIWRAPKADCPLSLPYTSNLLSSKDVNTALNEEPLRGDPI